MKSITDLENFNNQIVLLRLDLNVPILDGKITDTNRIDKIIPTINFLLSKNAKIIIISPHLSLLFTHQCLRVLISFFLSLSLLAIFTHNTNCCPVRFLAP